jgi:hypothetical protein
LGDLVFNVSNGPARVSMMKMRKIVIGIVVYDDDFEKQGGDGAAVQCTVSKYISRCYMKIYYDATGFYCRYFD